MIFLNFSAANLQKLLSLRNYFVIFLSDATRHNGNQIVRPNAAKCANRHEDILIYITMPIMSFVIEMNGPVANAGSIFNFSSVSGTKVPNTDAKMTTANRLTATAMVVTCDAPKRKQL